MVCQPKISCTDEERDIIRSLAAAAELPVAAYVRMRALGQHVSQKMPQRDREAIGSLRKMLGMAKQIFRFEKADTVLTQELLMEIVETIRWIRCGVIEEDEEDEI